MKINLPAGLPVFTAALCVLILSGPFHAARAQDAVEAAPPVAAAEVPHVEAEEVPAPKETPKQETAPTKAKPAFSGLIPPSGVTADVTTYGIENLSGDDTHPMLKITSDKSEIIRLDREAASIVVGSPDHLGVLMDNRRLLILVPRAPGATYMTVLDAEGSVIMQRHVIVASPKTDYIRIRRSCAGQGSDCQPTSVYYCPGMCHPVGIPKSGKSGEVAPIAGGPVSSDTANANENDDSNVEETPATE